MKNPAPPRPGRCARSRAGARVAMTGTPVENNLTELWAILDWATPGLLGSRHAFRKRWAAPVESGVDPAVTRQFAELIGPFVLRRRKSDPGIAPELPAKTETDHPLGLTREQVVLYEAFVQRHDGADRAGRPATGHPARPGARAAHRPQADLQPPGALPQAVRRRPADRAARRSSSCSTSWSAPCSPRTARRWSSRSTSRWDGCSRHTSPRAVSRTGSCTAAPRSASASRWWRRSRTARPGLPALAQGRRHRAQPDPCRPRHPRRPLVEPGRRGAGHRPGLPDRPDQARPGAPPDHRGHHRGEDRRAAGPQAGAGRLGAGPRRGGADRAQRRRAARPRDPPPREDRRHGGTDDPDRTSSTRGSRRAARRPGRTSWWGKAWVRAVEEASYS